MNRFFSALTAFALLAVAATADEGPMRRVALAIGSHDGKGRERLMYAGSDAAAFRRTLEELGGLRRGDATLLIDPDSLRVLRALDDMETRVRALKREGVRVEAIVYYSGHANEKGLMLGRQSVDYRLFRTRMNALGADVRLAVVDACESGALTRLKGGRSAPAFLVDKSTRSEGYAILTSSSESEAAQESDRVGGSFFTHALNTGLRGAADASRDGKVTLHEAYQFAYNETLARTESTRGGPQHAGYDIQLNGSGDVVLTDLRQGSAFLDLAENLQGRLFVRDSTDHLAVELQKPAGRDMRIGLSPGVYGLRLLRNNRWSSATVTLKKDQGTLVEPSQFKSLVSERTVLRGEDTTIHVEADDDSGFQYVSNDAPSGFASGIFVDVLKTEWRGTQLGLIGTHAKSNLRGGQLALVFNSVGGDLEGFQAAVGLNLAQGSVHGVQVAEANFVSENLKGAQISPLLGVVGGHATGVQASGVFNVVVEGLEGWQAAGIFGISGGPVKGGQLAGVFNIAADSVKGVQGAGVFNINADTLRGGQGAGVFNISAGNVEGGQGAGVVNIAAGDIEGGQGAGVLNISGGSVTGGQGAGVLNIAGGEVSGGQGAGVMNVSGGVHGGQGAGVVNVAFAPVRGFQAAGVSNVAAAIQGVQVSGVLNIAGKVKGTQIGLINISDEYESGVPVGLLNVSAKGSFEADGWMEENGMAYVGLRTGVRWMHSHFAVGVRERGAQKLVAPTLGMSMNYAFTGTPLFLETGLLYSLLLEMPDYAFGKTSVESDWGRARMGLGIKPLSFLSIVGGVSYNCIVHPYADSPLIGGGERYARTYGNTVTLWPGVWAGVRIGK